MPDADEPGGWHGLRNERLHASPKIYYSAYSRSTLDAMAGRLAADATQGRECWCIFDNTAAFAATGDALAARERLHGQYIAHRIANAGLALPKINFGAAQARRIPCAAAEPHLPSVPAHPVRSD